MANNTCRFSNLGRFKPVALAPFIILGLGVVLMLRLLDSTADEVDSSVELENNWRDVSSAGAISCSTDLSDMSLVAMLFTWARVHKDMRTSTVGNTIQERNLSSPTPGGQYNISCRAPSPLRPSWTWWGWRQAAARLRARNMRAQGGLGGRVSVVVHMK